MERVVEQMNSISAGIDRVQHSIRELSTNSEKIGNIIGVITGIADQTNLLALNAAIEAVETIYNYRKPLVLIRRGALLNVIGPNATEPLYRNIAVVVLIVTTVDVARYDIRILNKMAIQIWRSNF